MEWLEEKELTEEGLLRLLISLLLGFIVELEERPAETLEERPAEVLEERPAEMLEERPAEILEETEEPKEPEEPLCSLF